MSREFAYGGTELEVFAEARHWKTYWRSHLAGYVGGDVLEVGAGIGANTAWLCGDRVRRWVWLEPDPELAARVRERTGHLRGRCEVVTGTLAGWDARERFDSILYLDVLEHIDDDRAELARAASLLRRAGVLVVLAPAHQWLFSAFDYAIGHRRRYSKRTLAELMPGGLVPEKLVYLDSAGLLASVANRFLFSVARPTRAHITMWDTLLVPCSRWFDSLLGHSVGKSILAVWRRIGQCRAGPGLDVAASR
jgi:2-polyprenyl-3-methyl-5-hydroxy-6-metoxy-1,4-benzoquinol methylase